MCCAVFEWLCGYVRGRAGAVIVSAELGIFILFTVVHACTCRLFWRVSFSGCVAERSASWPVL